MASYRRLTSGKILAEVRIRKNYASKTFADKLTAQEWAVEKERQFGKHKEKLISRTFYDAMQKFIEETAPHRKGQRWETIRLKRLQKDPIANIMMHSLTQEDFQDWVNRRSADGITGDSVRRELDILNSVLREARQRWKWIDHTPSRDLRLPKKSPGRERVVSDKERDTILTKLAGKKGTVAIELAIGFQLALETAMRRGEIWGATWENLHLAKRYIHLPDTKNGTSRDVPLNKRAIALIESLPSASDRTDLLFRTNIESAGVLFRAVVKDSLITDLHFHDTRHTAITWMADRMKPMQLARAVGHKNLNQTLQYFNPSATDLAGLLD